MPDNNKQGRIFLLDRAKAQQTGTIWLSLFQEAKLVRDLVGGKNLSNPGDFITDFEGKAATFNGSQYNNLALPAVSDFQNIIVCARIKATAAQATGGGSGFSICGSTVTNSSIGIGFSASNDAVGHYYLQSNGAGLSANSAAVQDVYYTVFVQRTGTNNVYAWINGNPATSGQGSGTGSSVGTFDEISIGSQHRSSGFIRPFKGNIEWASILYIPGLGGNALSNEFAKYLYESNYPYSLEAKPSRIWVAAAGGDVTLAAAATSQATASANLTTAIPITAAALSIASASSTLSTAIPLAGVAASQSTASANLTAGSGLSANAQVAASTSGALTAQIRITANALAQAISSAALSSGIIMSAAAVSQAAAQGTLATAIRLIASATGQATASASLTAASSGLSADAQAVASANAALTIQIRLSANAVAQASAQGALTAYFDLSADALAAAVAAGALTAQVTFSADAFAQALAVAVLAGSAYAADVRYAVRIPARRFYVARKKLGAGYTASIEKNR